MFFYERVYWGARGYIDRLLSGKPKASPSDTAAAGKATSGAPAGPPAQMPLPPTVANQGTAAPAQTPAGSAVNPLMQRVPVTA